MALSPYFRKCLMIRHKKIIYKVLLVFFIFFEGLHLFGYLIPEHNPLNCLKPLGHCAPLSLVFLMLLVIKVSEHEKEALDNSLESGKKLLQQIEDKAMYRTDIRCDLLPPAMLDVPSYSSLAWDGRD